MKSFDFIVILADLDHSDSAMADALFEAGCDDGTLYSGGGEVAIGFSREAQTLEEAVRSAIADVAKAGFTVGRVDPADATVFDRINRELTVQ